MKIRTGFVSNSSSSSFLIYGVFLERSEISTYRLDAKEKDPDAPEDEDEDDVYDDMYELADKAGLEAHCPECCEGWYVGASWDDVKDDETGKQFKERVEAKLKTVFKDELVNKCGTHAEAWMG